MRDRAFTDIGDDLHVAMGMCGKAGVGRDLVVIPDAQRAVAHIAGVVIAGKGKMVFCLQPAVVGAAERCKRSEFDHWDSPLGKYVASWITPAGGVINRNYRNSLFQELLLI